MKLQVNIKYEQKMYTKEEGKIIKDIFGLNATSIYFNLNINEEIDEKHKIINFTGISGSGKTLIKEQIKEQLVSENKEVLDFDDLVEFDDKFADINILELFNIKKSDDDILKILGSFGLFEMRILLSKISLLSQGQKTRLKYIYMIFNSNSNQQTNILIDEFLTFVDSTTAISFSRGIEKYLKGKNIRLFTFGVNSQLVGQFESISYQLGNSSINAIIENGEIRYK